MADCDKCFMIVAIDFGTTFSGYAFQLSSAYCCDDPTNNILCPQAWNSGRTQLASLKTPTALLLDRNQDLDSFGYEAEDRYADLCLDKDNHNYYYFRRFKMELHDKKGLSKSVKLTDETGKELSAITVFARSIEALKNHLFKMMSERGIKSTIGRIKWVLTVPAIWDDPAKQFMREAAKEAGIKSEDLSIALEPEAASLYCQYLPVEKLSMGGQTKFSDAKPGTTYMIVDLGGGTADITVHEKVSKGKLKEVDQANGGPWGGTAVDAAFIRLLCDIIGGPVFSKFSTECKYDYLDLMREFENVKRNVSASTKDDVKIKLPASLNDTCTKMVKKDFIGLVKVARKDKQITLAGDKIKLNPDLVRSLFRKVTDKIISHMKKVADQTEAGKRISLILMVGGFSESAYVQDLVKAEFHDKKGRKVLVPKDAGISVLNGAVVFGRHPENITSRVLRYTYGAEVTPEFDANEHKTAKRYTDKDGNPRCNDVFSRFIVKGTNVKRNHVVEETYFTVVSFQSSVLLQIYVTDADDAKYTDDDGCRYLGEITVVIPKPSEDEHTILVQYTFGETELHISAHDKRSGHDDPCTVTLKMLE